MLLSFLLGFAGWSTAIPCSSPDGTLQPDLEDCNNYYVCANGELIQNKCPEGLHFNPHELACDFPETAGCVNSQTTATEAISTEVTYTESTIGETTVCDTEVPTEPETTVTTTTETPNNQKCPSTGIAFLPNFNDCNKYYECVNGAKFEFNCPPDLHFNPISLTCDWPELAGCKLDKDENSDVVADETTEGWNPPIIDDPDCPNEGIIFLPNPKECTQYFECVEGNKYLFTCPPNLHFNPAIDACDYPENAGCEASIKIGKTL